MTGIESLVELIFVGLAFIAVCAVVGGLLICKLLNSNRPFGG